MRSTMLNEAPERLHCFYNKKSTFVHGVEGEDVPTSYGQQVRIVILLVSLFE